MKSVVTILLSVFCCHFLVSAQTTITLQPDATAGKDVMLHGLPTEANNNYGNSVDFLAAGWTFSGNPGVIRSIVEFDLTGIPENAIVTSAKLSLYARDNTGGIGQHSTLSGPNNCWLERIISSWEESTVTWNTQPTTTTINRVNLPSSSSPTQDYIDIDVMALTQDMIDNPSGSFGFMLKLADENFYRKLVFCSSDHETPALRPRLEVIYTIPTASNELNENDFSVTVYPNPAGEMVTIKVNSDCIGSSYTINDMLERTVLTGTLTLEKSEINVSQLSPGLYIMRVGEKNKRSIKLMKK